VRRWVWGIRVGFLAVAAVLLVGAVQMRREYEDGLDHDIAPDAVPESKVLQAVPGVTGQGKAIDVDFDAAGRPRQVYTTYTTWCSMGYELDHGWLASDGGGDRFEWEGDRLRVRTEETEVFAAEDGGDRLRKIVTMRARVSGDRQVDGVIRGIWHYTSPRGRPVARCDSGPVAFAAGGDARRRLAKAMGLAR
jgi:hypothetical protein